MEIFLWILVVFLIVGLFSIHNDLETMIGRKDKLENMIQELQEKYENVDKEIVDLLKNTDSENYIHSELVKIQQLIRENEDSDKWGGWQQYWKYYWNQFTEFKHYTRKYYPKFGHTYDV
jgi:predicted RND superfamily exporter protein